jgi:hypothetical protein
LLPGFQDSRAKGKGPATKKGAARTKGLDSPFHVVRSSTKLSPPKVVQALPRHSIKYVLAHSFEDTRPRLRRFGLNDKGKWTVSSFPCYFLGHLSDFFLFSWTLASLYLQRAVAGHCGKVSLCLVFLSFAFH